MVADGGQIEQRNGGAMLKDALEKKWKLYGFYREGGKKKWKRPFDWVTTSTVCKTKNVDPCEN